MKQQITIIIIIIIIIIVGFLYWNKKNNISNQSQKQSQRINNTQPVILGDSDTNLQSSQTNNNIINDNSTYNNKILGIRQPLNDNMEDIIEKIKYTNLFPQEEIINLTNETDQKIDIAKDEINNLEVSLKYSDVNQKHIESLNLLKEALEALRTAYKNKDQKQIELFSYKIEQSNKIITEIQEKLQ